MFPGIQNVEGKDNAPDSKHDVLLDAEEYMEEVIVQVLLITSKTEHNTPNYQLVSRFCE